MTDEQLAKVLDTRSRSRNLCPHRFTFVRGLSKQEMNAVSDWCATHCQGLWNTSVFGHHFFYFEKDSDYVMFSLKWGSLNAG